MTIEYVEEHGVLVATLIDNEGDPIKAHVYDVDGDIVLVYVVDGSRYVYLAASP